MKKTSVIGAGLALGLALVATVALALGPGFGPGFGPRFGRGFGGPERGAPPIQNLTAEQSAQIQALRDGYLKETEPLQKEIYAKGTEFRSLWSSSSTDPAALKAKQKEILDLHSPSSRRRVRA
jgi:Spy/CpxP family protein refolding chaperone